MKHMQILILGVIPLMLLLTASPVIAQGAQTGYGSSAFYWTQKYDDWYIGPGMYYEMDVIAIYTATNTWTSITYPNGNVRESLVQEGIAEIYEASDTPAPGFTPFTDSWGWSGYIGGLIDTRDFVALEKFFDKDGNASSGSPGGYYTPTWWSPDMERYHYIWRIQGVYEFELWAKDGYWTYTFTANTAPPTVISGS